MKTKLLLFISAILFLNITSAQNADVQNIGQIRKGNIMLSDGTKVDFKELQYQNDSITYKTKTGAIERTPISKVYRIDKYGNYAVAGAISCAIAGCLGAVSGTLNWKTEPLKSQKGGWIVGCTIGGAVIGGITGLCVKKNKTIYKNTNVYLGYMYKEYSVFGTKTFLTLNISIPIGKN